MATTVGSGSASIFDGIVVNGPSQLNGSLAVAGAANIATPGNFTVGTTVVNGVTQSAVVALSGIASTTVTGIPSWAKRINVILNQVSTNGTSGIQLRVGNGAVVTSGYTGTSSYAGGGGASGTFFTAGVNSYGDNGASANRCGGFTLDLVASNLWIIRGLWGISSGASAFNEFSTGVIQLTSALDRIYFGTTNGTDLFNNGSVVVTWE